MSFPSSLNVSN